MNLLLTDQNFEEEIKKATLPVLVDFYADWCGPCKLIAPIVDELAGQLADKLTVAKLDVDANQQTAIKYSVMSIPTLIVFKNGEEAKRIVGFAGRDQLVSEINGSLG